MNSISYKGRLVVPENGSESFVVVTDAGFRFERLQVKLAKKQTVVIVGVSQNEREVRIDFMNATTFARALIFTIEGVRA